MGVGGPDPSIQQRRAGASVSRRLSTRPRRDGRDEDRQDRSILARCEVIRGGGVGGSFLYWCHHSAAVSISASVLREGKCPPKQTTVTLASLNLLFTRFAQAQSCSLKERRRGGALWRIKTFQKREQHKKLISSAAVI